jgi:hypothetical protein
MEKDSLGLLRSSFASLVLLDEPFEQCIIAVLPSLNRMAANAENWQLIFDLLHWDWGATRPPVPVETQDNLALALSPWKSETAQVLASQRASAEEWAEALGANGISPMEALGLSSQDLVLTVEKESGLTQVAQSKSHLSIPLELVRQYRMFYRASKMYRPERTNALKPLLLAKEVVQRSTSSGEDLCVEVAGRIGAHMVQVRRTTAKGRWVISDQAAERQAIAEFASFVVYHLLDERFRGDKAQFSSKSGIGLIEDACYFLYLLEQDKENTNG